VKKKEIQAKLEQVRRRAHAEQGREHAHVY